MHKKKEGKGRVQGEVQRAGSRWSPSGGCKRSSLTTKKKGKLRTLGYKKKKSGSLGGVKKNKKKWGDNWKGKRLQTGGKTKGLSWDIHSKRGIQEQKGKWREPGKGEWEIAVEDKKNFHKSNGSPKRGNGNLPSCQNVQTDRKGGNEKGEKSLGTTRKNASKMPEKKQGEADTPKHIKLWASGKGK